MKENANSRNLIIVIAIIVAIGIAGYFYASRDRSSDTLLTSESASESASVDTDLLAALRALKKLKLDGGIFTDPAWATLKDFGKVLAPQPAGRANPFSAISAADSAFSGASTTSSR
ncbi:hypothetical protein KW799_02645 [Candidatus Parcubacteria bacterium]|nr:hypothetical protein [Candidatus Parcubacteria bacterium]